MNLPNMKDAKVRNKSVVQYIDQENVINKDLYCNKKYYIKTYGCQMNVHDSEEIKAMLDNLGFVETDVFEDSDLIILNTCAIRENAHDKVFGFLGRCKHLKKEKSDLIIALCGCMAQEENVVDEIKKKHPYIDIVFGTHNINELPNLLMCSNNKLNIEVFSKEGNVFENVLYHRDSKITAWVNIMFGCDKFCTYCIVPYTRGKQRSRKSAAILKEVVNLREQGYKEVTLLGQNVNAYGKDLDDEIDFATLLKKVSETGIERIRFVTSHPWDFSDEMIEVISECDNVMPYIHLPLQSGSDKILKLMGRRYTKDDYLKLVDKIKSKIPNASITTDIIVGFPNETEEDFEDTLEVVNKVKYDGAFTFIYSPRENTPASKMPDSISLETKEKRLQRLNEVVNKYSLMNNKKLEEKIVKVLLLGESEKDHNKLYGYTDTMKLVNVEGNKKLIGSIVDVKILTAKSFSLDGIVL